MNFMSAGIVYIVIWTVVLFMVLPFGNHVSEQVEEGHASSAPSNPRIWEKVLITSILSAILWAGIYWFLTSDYARLN